MTAKLRLTAIALTSLLGIRASEATEYTYIALTPPGAVYTGGSYVTANSVDDAGNVYGYTYNNLGSGGSNGFIYNAGSYAAFNYPAATYTEPGGASANGTVAGSWWFPGQAFIYSGGTFQNVSDPNGILTVGSAVNNAGTLVGYYLDSNSIANGFAYAAGTFTPISFPGATDGTYVEGINNAGTITGWANTSTGVTSFIDDNGSFTTLNVPGSVPGDTIAYGINNLGDIVGYFDNANVTDGYVDAGGTFSVLAFPGAIGTFAWGLNDSGVVVGAYLDSNGQEHAFEAIPTASDVPEPTGLSLLATGILGCYWLRRRPGRLR